MPYHCCVPKCRSNFDGEPTTSVFSFPKDKEQRDKWLQSIKRKGFVPTKTSKVCEVHFKKEEVEHSTKFYTLTGDVLDVPLNIPRLKKGAVPCTGTSDKSYSEKDGSKGSASEFPEGKSELPDITEIRNEFKCVICDATEHRTRSLDIGYHPFPNDIAHKSQTVLHWRLFCSQLVPSDVLDKPDILLCSLHFHKSSFRDDNGKSIKPSAIPSILKPLEDKGELNNFLDRNSSSVDNTEMIGEEMSLDSSSPPTINEKACRLCLKEDSNIIPILSEVTFDDLDTLDLAGVFQCLTGESRQQVEEPKLPKGICKTCITLMVSAYEFRKKYDLSRKSLNQILLSSAKIKNETDLAINYEANNDSSIYKLYQDGDEGETDSFATEHIGNFDYPVPMEETVLDAIKLAREITKENDELAQDLPSTIIRKLHRCPVCDNEFTAVELRKHSHQHLSLKSYIRNAPKSIRKLKFYAKPWSKKDVVNLTYSCPFCNDTFNGSTFRDHVTEHHEKGNYRCKFCHRTFLKINHLKMHQLYHKKEMAFRCDECGAGFFKKEGFETHKLTHTTDPENLKFHCDICPSKFYDYNSLKRHKFGHNNPISYQSYYKPKKWQCSECCEDFKAGGVNQHNCKFTCDKCHQIFDKKEFRKHTCTVKNTFLGCDKCGKAFVLASSLKNHRFICKVAKIPNPEGKLCDICGETSYGYTAIRKHRETHFPMPRYTCTECGNGYSSAASLRIHIDDMHRNEVVYPCKFCDQKFPTKWKRSIHLRIHRPLDGCHICGLKLQTRRSLRYHLEKIHGESSESVNNVDNSKLGDTATSTIKEKVKVLSNPQFQEESDDSELTVAIAALDVDMSSV